jgi:3-oxoacyl-[acyl-carrier-protein] synthase II
MVAPRPDGTAATRVIAKTLHYARLTTRDIGYINAHASSTKLNDRVETQVLKSVFGDRAPTIPVSGTKAMHGHSLGASGAVEAAICAMIFRNDFLPPTIHLNSPDPDCDLDYIPNKGRSCRVDAILSTSFGFGGINAALVLGRFQE